MGGGSVLWEKTSTGMAALGTGGPWRGSCDGAGVSSENALVRGLGSHPVNAMKRCDFRWLGLRAVSVREEENGKTSGRFYLENCSEDGERFEVE